MHPTINDSTNVFASTNSIACAKHREFIQTEKTCNRWHWWL